MPPQYLTHKGAYFVWLGGIETKELPKRAGFSWNKPVERKWATGDPLKAMQLEAYADDHAGYILRGARKDIEWSRQASPDRYPAEIPCPDGLQYRPYQQVGIQYALERKNTLIADEMGLGKTIQAIGLANAIQARSILVICPASLRLNWRNEFQKWSVKGHFFQVITSSKDMILEIDTGSVIIVNYDLVIAKSIYDQLICLDYDLIILDEAHCLKNPKAKRTQMILGSRRKADRLDGIASRGARLLALTGTPITNRPVELWTLVNSMAPDQFPNFVQYGIRYCAGHQKMVPGRPPKQVWDFSGASNLGELQLKLRSSIMIRRLKADVLGELPPKVRRVVTLPSEKYSALLGEELDGYVCYQSDIELAEEGVETARRAGDREAYEAAVERLRYAHRVAFTAMARIRHQVALAKLEPGTQYLLDALDETDKIIVFAHHKAVIEGIVKALDAAGIGCVSLTGDTPMAYRQAAVEAFQNDPGVRVFVGNIQAAGVGITLTAASRVIFLELSPVPADMSQAEDRAHRIGQRESVLIEHLVFDGSLDARFAQLLIEKQTVLDAALDNEVEMPAPIPVPEPERFVRSGKSFPVATEEERAAVLAGLRYLARQDDDYARTRNGVGFSKVDGRIGHDLARQTKLTDGQVWLGRKILGRYRQTQLTAEITEAIWGGNGE